MSQIRKTFSLDEKIIELFNQLMVEKNMTNQSECLRQIICEECVRCGILNEVNEINYVPHIDYSQKYKSEIMMKLDRLEVIVTKIKNQETENTEMTYQIRDGLNSYLTYIDTPDENFVSADEKLSPPTVHSYFTHSMQNYNEKNRNLSIAKSNLQNYRK